MIKCQHDPRPAISSYLKFFQLRKLAATYREATWSGHWHVRWWSSPRYFVSCPTFLPVYRGRQSGQLTRVTFRRSKIVSFRDFRGLLYNHVAVEKKKKRSWKKVLRVLYTARQEEENVIDRSWTILSMWFRFLLFRTSRMSVHVKFKQRERLIREYVSSRISTQSDYLKNPSIAFQFHSKKFTSLVVHRRSLHIYRI